MNKTAPIERIPRFEKQLKKLNKKHPGFREDVQHTLCGIATETHPPGDLLPGYCAIQDIFKVRVGNAGKRMGRIIYCWDSEILLALFVYVKNDIYNFTSKDVQQAIRDHRQNRDLTV